MPAEREFLSEPVVIDATALRTAAAQAGEPPLPARFTWRDRAYDVVEVLRTWKSTDAGHRGPGMVYLRRHWAEIRTACGARMRLYAERGRPGSWVLHSRERPGPSLKT